MPELPEVETVARGLRRSLVGRRITAVWTSGLRLRVAVSPKALRRLIGRAVTAVRRRGKYLLIDTDGERSLLAHLGMTGRMLVRDDAPPPHTHVRLTLDRGTLYFADARRFGLLRVIEADRGPPKELASLGPDALHELRASQLVAACRGSRRKIRDLLLDQRVAAGIGNIYAAEALHRAGIDPRRRADRISTARVVRLHAEIRRVLAAGVSGRGTTMRDFVASDGRPGQYGDDLLVYAREGEECHTCGRAIRRVSWGARSSFLCPRCQR